MGNHPTRRGYFLTAMAGSLLGLIVGALVVTVLPVEAATGDPVIAGQANAAGKATKITSRSTSTLRLTNNRPSGGVGLEIITPPGQPPLRVNRAAWVQNLHADLLDGRQAHELIRVAYGSTNNAPDRQNGDMVSATIITPGPGFLVMSGSIESQTGDMPVWDRFQCVLKVDGTEVTGSRRVMLFTHAAGESVYEADLDENCATDGVQPVTAGSHTVALAMEYNDTADLGGAVVWALFVPFDGNGNVP